MAYRTWTFEQKASLKLKVGDLKMGSYPTHTLEAQVYPICLHGPFGNARMLLDVMLLLRCSASAEKD